jgi:hypothetical protein
MSHVLYERFKEQLMADSSESAAFSASLDSAVDSFAVDPQAGVITAVTMKNGYTLVPRTDGHRAWIEIEPSK